MAAANRRLYPGLETVFLLPDEAHMLKNMKSARTRRVGRHMKESPHTIFMTVLAADCLTTPEVPESHLTISSSAGHPPTVAGYGNAIRILAMRWEIKHVGSC